MKKCAIMVLSVMMSLSVIPLVACGEDDGKSKQNAIGGMPPADALEYMKKTDNLIIVDVAAKRHYDNKHFTGAINIPIEELSSEEEDVLYNEIPSGRPVILHCRAGAIVPGAYRRVIELRHDIPEISYVAGAPLFDEYNEWLENKNKNDNNSEGDDMNKDQNTSTTQKQLGGLTPTEALEYIKNTPNIVIVQVNTAYWKIEPGFTGALWIPHDEMENRYNEIPTGVPVILHCGAGVVSVPAYETLIEKRPDIPELSYIAGSPHTIMAEYNAWLADKN